MSRFFTIFVRFLGDKWPWRRVRGGSDGKNAIVKTPLHGSFINAYVCEDFGRDSFGRVTPAFKREKRAARGVVFAIFFEKRRAIAKIISLLIEIISLLVEIISHLVCPMSLLIFPMSLLVSRKRAIGQNEGGWGRKK